MVKINVRRCVAADFQVSGVDGSELCIAILPENLPCSRYSGTESNPLLNICVCVNVFAALVFAESFSEFLSSARSDAFAIPDTAGTVTDVPVIGSVIVMSPLPVRAVDHPWTTLRQRVNALASWFAKDDVLAVSDVIIPYFAPEKQLLCFSSGSVECHYLLI